MDDNAQTLAKHFPQLAAALDAGELAALGAAMRRERVRAGNELLRQGSRHAALYFLVEGTFGLRLGEEQSPADLGYLPAGSVVGEVSFFDGGPATASVMAISVAATALLLDSIAFETLATEHPRAAGAVCQIVCDTLAARLRVATERYDRLVVGPGIHEQPHRVKDLLRTLFGIGKHP